MKRRSLIVNSFATSIGAAVHSGAGAAAVSLRATTDAAEHLGLHRSVWVALADRVQAVLPEVGRAYCGQAKTEGDFRFEAVVGDKASQKPSWSLQAENRGVAFDLPVRSVLVCDSRLAAQSGELSVLRTTRVTAAGGVALYLCKGNAGDAVLLFPTRGMPPSVIGVALNE